MVTPQADNSLSITLYHNPTHTDQYLQWDSHHNLSAKYSVIGTLTHRAKIVCTKPELFQKELQHLREALVKCKYSHWAINRVQSKYINSNWEAVPTLTLTWIKPISAGTAPTHHKTPTIQAEAQKKPPTRQKLSIGFVVIPYTKGIAESFKKTCGKYGIQTYFKGNTTIKQLLTKPKDRDPKGQKSGVIYSYQCGNIACSEEYIGETSRTLGKRYKGHLKQPSPIHVHIQQTRHSPTANNFNIIGREDQDLARTIKEAIYISVKNPTLNRNIGKCNLIYIRDRVLFNTPGLKLDPYKTNCTT